jgi:hypothetical protein
MSETRDPRKDPKPGDELFGGCLKTKVLSITLDEAGVSSVEYSVSHKDHPYHPEYSARRTLDQWIYFAEPATRVIPVEEHR